MTKQQPDKHDKQIAAIRDLVQQGKRLGVETRKDLRALAAAQRRTEESLQHTEPSLKPLIDRLRGPRSAS